MASTSPPRRLHALLARLTGKGEADWARLDGIWNPAWRWADVITNPEPAKHDSDLEPVRGPLGWQLMALGPDREPHARGLPPAWAAVLGTDLPPMSLLEAVCLRLWRGGGERAWSDWTPIAGSTQPPVAEALHQGWLPLATAIAEAPDCPHLGQLHLGCFGPVHTALHVADPAHLCLVLRHGASPDWPVVALPSPTEAEDDAYSWRAQDGRAALHGITTLTALDTLLDAGATTTPLTPMLAPTWPDAAWGTFPTDTATWLAMADRLAAHRTALGVDPVPGRRHMLIHAWRLGRRDLAEALGRDLWLASDAPLVVAQHAAEGEVTEQGLLAAILPDPLPSRVGVPWRRAGMDQTTARPAGEGWPTDQLSWEDLRTTWLVPALQRPDLLSHRTCHAFPHADPLTLADGRWAWARWVAERVAISPERRFVLMPCDTDPQDPAWHAVGEVWGATPSARWTAYIALCLCNPGPGHWAHPWLLSTHPMGQVLGPLVLADLPEELLDFWAAAWQADQAHLFEEAFLPICWDRARWTLRGRYPPALIEAVLAHDGLAFLALAEALLGEWVLQRRLAALHEGEPVLAGAPALEPALVQWGLTGHRPAGKLMDQPETQAWLAEVRKEALSRRPSMAIQSRRRV